MESIADRLRRLRTTAGLTQSQLAGTVASTSYISLVEAGKRIPGPEVLAHLARRLGCTTSYLQHGDEADAITAARRDLAHAQMALGQGQWQAALERLSALASVERPAGLPEDLAFDVHFAWGRAHEAVGDLEAAVTVLNPLLKDAIAQGRHLRQLVVANTVAGCYLDAADLAEAARVAREALTAGEQAGLGTTDEHLRLLATLSWVMFEQGDLLAARDLLGSAIPAAEREASPLARGSLYWNASLVADGRGHHCDAVDLAERAVALMGEHAGQRDLARLRVHYSYLLLRGMNPLPQVALEQAERAEADLRQVASWVDVAACLTEQARALLQLGRAEEAEQRVRASLVVLHPAPAGGVPSGVAAETDVEAGAVDAGAQAPPRLEGVAALLVLAQCLDVQGQADAATAAYERAATTLSMLRLGRRAASTWRDLADRRRRRGDLQGALSAYEESLDAAGVRSSLEEAAPTPLPRD